MLALSTRYRQERDDARQECHSLSVERDQYQTRVGKLEEELKETEMQLSSFKALNNTYFSQYKETFNNERAARRKAEQSNTELIALKRTMKQERQAFGIQLDRLETTQVATAIERDRIRSQLTNVPAVESKELTLRYVDRGQRYSEHITHGFNDYEGAWRASMTFWFVIERKVGSWRRHDWWHPPQRIEM